MEENILNYCKHIGKCEKVLSHGSEGEAIPVPNTMQPMTDKAAEKRLVKRVRLNRRIHNLYFSCLTKRVLDRFTYLSFDYTTKS